MMSEKPKRNTGRKGGRNPIGEEPKVVKSFTVSEEHLKYLRSINERNMSEALSIALDRAMKADDNW